ncbi:Cytochrome p450(bm-3) / nadph-cytochrome p450 reductase/ pre-mRNA splicing helicase BRR2 [Giardia duodenalis assemblage B]|uniref:Cytochrome p450(Bm-3) / nadph-cytochrome p450 reductase/ pre-mRNA splicing helicase BRR2 n=1 Tax=Giardia duodenalis assemblage B TaxID=1394984 RepID=A0A132NMU5_GIAIN|nr:Cytochrome p450(bm-3) / nadph-cytochrome p450 reductase/ pre-mRNA splicing helicase BRR2 [Giardia intestinalis assemblage B]
MAAVSGSVNHRDNPRLWIDHNQAKNVVRRTCRAQRRRHQRRACREEPSSDGETALMRAAACGGVAEVRRHLDECGGRDAGGRTALMHAAKKDHKEAVKVFLEHEKKMRDNQNHNALYHALKSRHMEATKIIIPHEDPRDENGVTALMRAAARGDTEMVKLLAPLQKGMKDRVGNTAFMHALKSNHAGTAMVLREHEAPLSGSLMFAAAAEGIEEARPHLSDEDIAEFSDIFNNDLYLGGLGHTPYP